MTDKSIFIGKSPEQVALELANQLLHAAGGPKNEATEADILECFVKALRLIRTQNPAILSETLEQITQT